MPTTITNQGLQTMGGKAVLSLSGLIDSLKPFTSAYDVSVSEGGTVKLPVFTYGAALAVRDFTGDGNAAITFKNVTADQVASYPVQLTRPDYEILKGVSPTLIKGLVTKAGKAVTDAVYTAFQAAFPVASNKIVDATWAEGDASKNTLANVRKLIGKAVKTGKLDPNNIIVAMPTDTYYAFISNIDSMARGVELGFTVVPVHTSAIANTFITAVSPT